MPFPNHRLRRLRQSNSFRRLVRETALTPDDLILPLFAMGGRDVKEPIESMPGQYRLSPDNIVKTARQAFEHDPRFREGLHRAHGDKFESTFYNWFNGWHTPKTLAWDMRPQLSQVQCPALVIQGEADEHGVAYCE